MIFAGDTSNSVTVQGRKLNVMPARRAVIAHNEDKREQTVSEVRGHVCIFMSLPAAGNTRNYSAY